MLLIYRFLGGGGLTVCRLRYHSKGTRGQKLLGPWVAFVMEVTINLGWFVIKGIFKLVILCNNVFAARNILLFYFCHFFTLNLLFIILYRLYFFFLLSNHACFILINEHAIFLQWFPFFHDFVNLLNLILCEELRPFFRLTPASYLIDLFSKLLRDNYFLNTLLFFFHLHYLQFLHSLQLTLSCFFEKLLFYLRFARFNTADLFYELKTTTVHINSRVY